jgi:hypothetical protein
MRKTALSSSAPSPWGTNYRSNINIRLPFVHKIHFTKPLTVSYTLRGTSSLTYCRLRLVLVLPRERMPGRNFTHVFQTPSIPSRETCGSLISRQHPMFFGIAGSCQVSANEERKTEQQFNCSGGNTTATASSATLLFITQPRFLSETSPKDRIQLQSTSEFVVGQYYQAITNSGATLTSRGGYRCWYLAPHGDNSPPLRRTTRSPWMGIQFQR